MRAYVLFAVALTGCVGFNQRRVPPPPVDSAAADGTGVFTSWAPGKEPQLHWQAIGYSRQQRPLRVTRLGNGPRKVLWVGGIHGDEREGAITTQELPAAFLAQPGLSDRVTLVLLEDVNPDGTANGTRGNSRGIDLNRNYPADNFKPNRFFGMRPLDQPEARALHGLVQREQPELVVVVHSWRGDHFINYDGPASELAARFSELSGYRVQESDNISPTPGSLGSWVGKTLGIPILTLEYQRGREPWVAWNETRSAILAVIGSG